MNPHQHGPESAGGEGNRRDEQAVAGGTSQPHPPAYTPPGHSYPMPWNPEQGIPQTTYADRTYPGSSYAGASFPETAWQLVAVPPARTSGKAIAALVTGILSILICPPVGIAAVFLGNSAVDEIDINGGITRGRGLAQAGRILGWISVLFIIAMLILLIVIFAVGDF
ncbi:hypothetical protein GCM10027169_20250 [Gordonia jinhuaensis]|uniref:DUF4190 domain-containing protein n=1 Tax=Gordonia jinhuaensis TaxID=1517702 RepID=A0A916TI21_9ACTN|nr:DUF4190 domain-containing protein [Gordonia jinhuaensis]GGB44045.1 hypothetical protein GCM10011489_34490 [Gordonia jinhuaensis]